MKKTFLLIAALAAPVVSFAQGTPRPISLSEAVSLAKKNSPSTILARGLIRTSSAQVTAAKWAFGPALTLNYGSNTSGGGHYINGQLITQANRGYAFSQSLGGLSMTLWDGGSKLASLHESQAAVVQVSEATEVAERLFGDFHREVGVLQRAQRQGAGSVSGAATAAGAATDGYCGRKVAGWNGATTADTLTASIAVGDARPRATRREEQRRRRQRAELTRSVATEFAVTAVVSDTTDPVPLQVNVNDLYMLAAQGPLGAAIGGVA